MAKGEIADSRQRLEELLGQSVSLFAYPNGKRGHDYEDAHVEMVRELGFDAAVSTNPGLSGPADDVYELRRYTPWRRKRLPFFAQLLSNGLTG